MLVAQYTDVLPQRYTLRKFRFKMHSRKVFLKCNLQQRSQKRLLLKETGQWYVMIYVIAKLENTAGRTWA